MIKFLFLILLFTCSFHSSTPAFCQFSKDPKNFVRSNQGNILKGNEYTSLNYTPFDTVVIRTDSPYFFFVSTAGDVNGDGFSDFMVGSNYSYSIGWRIQIYYGGVEMDSIPDLIIERTFSRITSLSTAGDVNGDGFSDIVLTILGPYMNIYLGGQPMDNILDAQFFLTVLGGDHNANIVSTSAGDLNGDGYYDIALGSGTSWDYWWGGGILLSCWRKYILWGNLD